MKAQRGFFLVLFLAVLWPVGAHADTDYKCLQNCMAKDKTASQCMPQCIVNPPAGSKKNVKSYVDYRCLNLCVREGKQAQNCMPQCTYERAAPVSGNPEAATQPDPPSHKVFNAPKPIGDEIVLQKKPASGKADQTTINYACINRCVQSGLQPEICAQQCNDQGTKP